MPQRLTFLPHPGAYENETLRRYPLESRFSQINVLSACLLSRGPVCFSGMNIALTMVVALGLKAKDRDSIPRSQYLIRVKRVYVKPEASDGSRFLVDRLWPRGLKKNDLALDGWFKDVAPSDHLREWFGHDPRKWQEFRRRYSEELSAKAETWAPILERARESTVTLLYGARDAEHNNAMALRDFLTERRRKKKKTFLLA
jgi:uncharacterized protein YeaO (DUF488 family)